MYFFFPKILITKDGQEFIIVNFTVGIKYYLKWSFKFFPWEKKIRKDTPIFLLQQHLKN